jgi:hypothetical protein
MGVQGSQTAGDVTTNLRRFSVSNNELREEIKALRGLVENIRTSLTVCQTRCHVTADDRRKYVGWTMSVLTSVLSAAAAAALTKWIG